MFLGYGEKFRVGVSGKGLLREGCFARLPRAHDRQDGKFIPEVLQFFFASAIDRKPSHEVILNPICTMSIEVSKCTKELRKMTSKGARFSPGRFPGASAQAAAGVLRCAGREDQCILPAPATREDDKGEQTAGSRSAQPDHRW